MCVVTGAKIEDPVKVGDIMFTKALTRMLKE